MKINNENKEKITSPKLPAQNKISENDINHLIHYVNLVKNKNESSTGININNCTEEGNKNHNINTQMPKDPRVKKKKI